MSRMSRQQTPWDELRLNRLSPMPLWVQLGREIRRCIAVRGLPAGTPLPSEPWLITRYGLTATTTGKAIKALRDAGQITGQRGHGYLVAEELPLEYVTVPPGSKITAPALHDPSIESDLPWWAVVVLRVEAPGMDPIYFDSTRTVLVVP
jgi:DNA-binding transcriptional MocR family regulator